ncbi:hypothetical protein HQQ94_16310 [Shewanella sp. VB17]|uniref:hypothetical protein n=1 Tax=Shewanella sp. VB17 TaxID=2739432 RepID=UPI0015655205|nr:hypothetical protein [Shewanella sp. VB17]NRD74753.1 hypothetical protein [Shewanella sp. VB17]
MKTFCRIIGIGLLAILFPFLTASEKSVKSIIDDWFETCSIIVDMGSLTTDKNKEFYTINLFVQGNPPESADLVISSDRAVFTQLKYIHELSSNNRSLHPNTPQTPVGDATKNISVSLKPFRKNLLYSFRAYVEKNSIVDNTLVSAFVKFPTDTVTQTCRVEESTWFNILVGASSTRRFVFVLILVVVLYISIVLIRAKL